MSCWMCGATGGASGSVHFKHRRRDRQHAHAARLDPRAHAVDLGVAVVDDVLAVDDSQLGERHAEIGHRPERAVEAVGRELVRDGPDVKRVGRGFRLHRMRKPLPTPYLIGAGSRRGDSRCTISSATRYADAAMMNTGR